MDKEKKDVAAELTRQLIQDEITYGFSAYKIVNGTPERIEPLTKEWEESIEKHLNSSINEKLRLDFEEETKQGRYSNEGKEPLDNNGSFNDDYVFWLENKIKKYEVRGMYTRK